MRNTPLAELEGAVAPLMRANIDTDAIFPSRTRLGVDATDMSSALFSEWRLRPDGSEEPGFILNQPGRRDAKFLVALENFGCGSSRETAPWALRDWGIRCVVAPSFGSIFQANCHRNGIAPVVLSQGKVVALGALAEREAGLRLRLDLGTQRLSANGFEAFFAMDPGARRMLIEGLDEIGLTLTRRDEIEAFREEDRIQRPWAYLPLAG